MNTQTNKCMNKLNRLIKIPFLFLDPFPLMITVIFKSCFAVTMPTSDMVTLLTSAALSICFSLYLPPALSLSLCLSPSLFALLTFGVAANPSATLQLTLTVSLSALSRMQ